MLNGRQPMWKDDRLTFKTSESWTTGPAVRRRYQKTVFGRDQIGNDAATQLVMLNDLKARGSEPKEPVRRPRGGRYSLHTRYRDVDRHALRAEIAVQCPRCAATGAAVVGMI